MCKHTQVTKAHTYTNDHFCKFRLPRLVGFERWRDRTISGGGGAKICWPRVCVRVSPSSKEASRRSRWPPRTGLQAPEKKFKAQFLTTRTTCPKSAHLWKSIAASLLLLELILIDPERNGRGFCIGGLLGSDTWIACCLSRSDEFESGSELVIMKQAVVTTWAAQRCKQWNGGVSRLMTTSLGLMTSTRFLGVDGHDFVLKLLKSKSESLESAGVCVRFSVLKKSFRLVFWS